MPNGVNDVHIQCAKAGINFYLPVNPTSIKWAGEFLMDVNETRAGRHFQFKKYRRTRGTLGINTGAAQNITINGVNVGTGPLAAYKYMEELGHIVEKWMKGNVLENYGPLRLTDNTIPEYPIVLDIIFSSWPDFGPDAAKTSYQINLSFDILTDYQDHYDMSTVKTDVLPGLARAKTTTSYVVKDGDTLAKIAKKVYGDEKLANLIQSITENNKAVGSGGKLKPGATLIIPYAPLPSAYSTGGIRETDGAGGLSNPITPSSGITPSNLGGR